MRCTTGRRSRPSPHRAQLPCPPRPSAARFAPGLAVDQPVAEDARLVDPRIVRGQSAGVAPMPVQRKVFRNAGCAERIEDRRRRLQRGGDDHQLRLGHRHFGRRSASWLALASSPCDAAGDDAVERRGCCGPARPRRRSLGGHLADHLQQLRIVGRHLGETLRIVAAYVRSARVAPSRSAARVIPVSTDSIAIW